MTADGESRVWTYSYDANGLTLTEDGPRADVSDTVTYTYDTQGDLETTTNALGHLTQYRDYDAHGRVGRMIDPNGVETVYRGGSGIIHSR